MAVLEIDDLRGGPPGIEILKGISVSGFWGALIGALAVTLVGVVVNLMLSAD